MTYSGHFEEFGNALLEAIRVSPRDPRRMGEHTLSNWECTLFWYTPLPAANSPLAWAHCSAKADAGADSGEIYNAGDIW